MIDCGVCGKNFETNEEYKDHVAQAHEAMNSTYEEAFCKANEGAKDWWESQSLTAQEQILIASGVDPRHKGLSWQNLGQENQALIKAEYYEAREAKASEGYDNDGNYTEKCKTCGKVFDNPADAGSHNHGSNEVNWRDIGDKKVIDKGNHYELEDGTLIDWYSYDADSAQKHLAFVSGGESKATEHISNEWWWKYTKWESGFDQDFLYCNKCGRDLYSIASWVEPLNNVGDDKMNKVVPDHLREHGIGESKAKEAKIGDFDDDRISISHYKGDGKWASVKDIKDIEKDKEANDEAEEWGHWWHKKKKVEPKEEKEDANEDDMDDLQFKQLTGHDWRDKKAKKGKKEDKTGDEGSFDNTRKVDALSESWNVLDKETRAKVFESLGITQGDAYTLANLDWYNLSPQLKKEASEAYVKEEDELTIDNDEDLFALHKGLMDKPIKDDKEVNEAYADIYNIEKNHLSPDFKKKALECSRCNEKFYNNKERDIHFNEFHATEQEYHLPEECPFCKELIKEPETLDWHMEHEHGAHIPSTYTQTGIQGAMTGTDFDSLDTDFYSEAFDADWACPRCGNKKVTIKKDEYGNPTGRTCPKCGLGNESKATEGKYHTLEVGGISQTFDTYEEMQEYYKNFPKNSWQYSESNESKTNEAKDRPVVQGDPVHVVSQQCFDWEGHEIDCDTGEIIGKGYSQSKAYQQFLNEAYDEWTCSKCGAKLPYGKSVGDHLLDHGITFEAKATEWSTGISSNDPTAIAQLEAKLIRLEDEKTEIKARPITPRDWSFSPEDSRGFELTNINANIRSVKQRIEELQSKAGEAKIPSGDLYQHGQRIGTITDYNPKKHEGYVTLDGIGIREFGAMTSDYEVRVNGERIPNKWDGKHDYNLDLFGEAYAKEDYSSLNTEELQRRLQRAEDKLPTLKTQGGLWALTGEINACRRELNNRGISTGSIIESVATEDTYNDAIIISKWGKLDGDKQGELLGVDNVGWRSFSSLNPSEQEQVRFALGNESVATEAEWQCDNCGKQFEDSSGATKHEKETGHHDMGFATTLSGVTDEDQYIRHQKLIWLDHGLFHSKWDKLSKEANGSFLPDGSHLGVPVGYEYSCSQCHGYGIYPADYDSGRGPKCDRCNGSGIEPRTDKSEYMKGNEAIPDEAFYKTYDTEEEVRAIGAKNPVMDEYSGQWYWNNYVWRLQHGDDIANRDGANENRVDDLVDAWGEETGYEDIEAGLNFLLEHGVPKAEAIMALQRQGGDTTGLESKADEISGEYTRECDVCGKLINVDKMAQHVQDEHGEEINEGLEDPEYREKLWKDIAKKQKEDKEKDVLPKDYDDPDGARDLYNQGYDKNPDDE